MPNQLLSSLLLIATVTPLTVVAGDDSVRTVRTTASRPDIRVDVNLALVPVTVMDSTGRSVVGLARENFRVLDGGEPVPIVSFALADQPITAGLVFDCSGSMRDKFPTAKLAPQALYNQLNDNDTSFLVTVSDRSQLRMGITGDFREIEDALLFSRPQGTTSLLDGVYLGLSQMKHATTTNKALIVVSDGGENNSRYTLRELEQIAVESDTQIYAIGLYDNPRTQEEVEGPSLLQRLARDTGGIAFQVQNVDSLRTAITKIGISLHNQYVLGYYPPESAPRGKYRKIKVQLQVPAGLPPLAVSARAGYYVPER